MKLNRSSGFSLLEVLIALVIFSLGMLGMAGLMVVSVKTNQSAYLRTQASFLAQTMADRMRGNLGLINTYNGTYSAATVGTDNCASGAPCAPAALVTRDKALWSQQLVDSLPNATATILCNGVSMGIGTQVGAAPYNGLCNFSIQWSESTLARGAAGTPDTQVFAWVFQP